MDAPLVVEKNISFYHPILPHFVPHEITKELKEKIAISEI